MKNKELKPLKPNINSNCIGCSVCTILCPNVFELNEKGVSTVKKLKQYYSEKNNINDAIEGCPVDAISWELNT